MQGEQLVTRLYNSFSDLERAIDSARLTLRNKEGVSDEIFRRLDTYEEIIARQKGLAEELREHIDMGNVEEVTRHVIIINSLSGMIIEDAKEILTSLGGEVNVEELLDAKDKIC